MRLESGLTPERGENGVTQIGYVTYGSVVREFLELMYAKNLVVQFDWPGWRGKEAVEQGDLGPIRAATPDDALRYLTVMIRADRFSEGTLLNAFESALVSTSLHRVLTHPATAKAH